MPRKHSKQSQSSALGHVELRVRRSRHGRVMVGSAPRDLDDQRPSPFVKRLRTIETAKDGTIVVKHSTRPMTEEEVQAERAKVRRATSSTRSYGKKNTPEQMAPKGKAGAKTGPGGVK